MNTIIHGPGKAVIIVDNRLIEVNFEDCIEINIENDIEDNRNIVRFKDLSIEDQLKLLEWDYFGLGLNNGKGDYCIYTDKIVFADNKLSKDEIDKLMNEEIDDKAMNIINKK